jgi:hypothetical protein
MMYKPPRSIPSPADIAKRTSLYGAFVPLCHCSCHPGTLPKPEAVEARLCQSCADERFQAWQPLVDVLMRDE